MLSSMGSSQQHVLPELLDLFELSGEVVGEGLLERLQREGSLAWLFLTRTR